MVVIEEYVFFVLLVKMRQYVGTHAAPASAALLFWALGRALVQAAINKIADLTVRTIREQAKRE